MGVAHGHKGHQTWGDFRSEDLNEFDLPKCVAVSPYSVPLCLTSPNEEMELTNAYCLQLFQLLLKIP